MKEPKETYVVYKQENGEPSQEEIRSAEELTSDEYYEYIEDDRIIPEEE